jgi:hypothetical protein
VTKTKKENEEERNGRSGRKHKIVQPDEKVGTCLKVLDLIQAILAIERQLDTSTKGMCEFAVLAQKVRS